MPHGALNPFIVSFAHSTGQADLAAAATGASAAPAAAPLALGAPVAAEPLSQAAKEMLMRREKVWSAAFTFLFVL